MTYRKKLIEVALPLEAINMASAREKSIRHGHPSTLHLWWARRPLAAARAVIFTSLVDDPDDPDDPDAPPAFVAACRALPKGKNATDHDTPRMRLFDFIERLVQWESTTDEPTLETARELIRLCTNGNPPPLLDPFAGGGSIPLEAQRLGLEAHASDLNPVAVMINKALIEIPPRFAGRPPVNPGNRGEEIGNRGEGRGNRGEEIGNRGGEDGLALQGTGGLAKGDGDSPSAISSGAETAARGDLRDAVPDHASRSLDTGQYRGGVDAIVGQGEGSFSVDLKGFTGGVGHPADPLREDRLVSGRGNADATQADGRGRPDADSPAAQSTGEAGNRGEGVGNRREEIGNRGEEEAGNSDARPGKLTSTLLFPISYSGAQGLAADVRYYGEWMRDRAFERIGHLYPDYDGETVIAWLWARTVKSPNPAVDAHVPLVRSFILSKKKGRECWAKPIIEGGQVRFEITRGLPPAGEEGTMGREYGGGRCIVSGVPIPWSYVREEGKAGRLGAMLMAVVTEGHNGRSYYSPNERQEEVARDAERMHYFKPRGEMPLKHRNFQPPVYGMYEYGDLFTPRQLVALTTFSDLVGEARARIEQDALAAGLPADDTPLCDGGRGARAYAEAVSVYLAFVVDKIAMNHNALCSWHNTRETIQTVFARQAIPMVWDYCEANSFSNSSGCWDNMLTWVVKVVANISSDITGDAKQQDAQSHDGYRNLAISTDPPYYDNIGYADLSDFFYVWLRTILKDVYPDLFKTMLVPKLEELVATPYRFEGGRAEARQFFEAGMLRTFTRINAYSLNDIPSTVYYAYKQTENDSVDGASSTGWETMLNALIQSGYVITGTWPVRTEMESRSLGRVGTNALASSIVLVCRPRPDDAPATSRRAFVAELRAALPAALRQMQSGNIAPVDLAQASIGPGMAVYSKYRQVLEANGEPLTVRAALQLINQVLDEHLAEQEGDMDGDSRFAVAWFEQYGYKEEAFGAADVLARAKNTSVDGLVDAGVLRAAAGKVQLLTWQEMDPGWDPQTDKRPTVWEATHHLVERLTMYGEEGAALLLAKMPAELAANARDMAYRLYSICERKGWADYAREYNALVVSWGTSQERAAQVRTTHATQGRLFEGGGRREEGGGRRDEG